MKLLSLQALLICICSIRCVKYCAHASINATSYFDTDEKKSVKIEYKQTKNESYCFFSLHSITMPKNLDVKIVSDCSMHFKGEVIAGSIDQVPGTMRKNKCYYQHDWVICVCTMTYCNSPQYWLLMLSRFSHNHAIKTRKIKGVFDDAKKMIKLVKANVTINKETKRDDGYRENLRCLIWFADTLYLEEKNPPFYLYNYVTTLHRAPPLADALTIPAVKRKESDWAMNEYSFATRLYVPDKEPYEDGTHETDQDYRTFPFEVKQDKDNAEMSLILAIAGLIVFFISLTITIFFLVSLCRRVQDHTLFSRTDDRRAYRRFDRCFKTSQMPKEFVKRRDVRETLSDAEAGPSYR